MCLPLRRKVARQVVMLADLYTVYSRLIKGNTRDRPRLPKLEHAAKQS